MSEKKAKDATTTFKPAATANIHIPKATAINTMPVFSSPSTPTSYSSIPGVPDFTAQVYEPKQKKYCVLIPIINEGERIRRELKKALDAQIPSFADMIICDGGSTDGCTEEAILRNHGVNTLLVKTGPGKQGAQLRMGIWWAMQRGYDGFITIDGNDKDSIEDIPTFISKLREGFDFIQGSRFIKGGRAINTPAIRHLALRFMHAPLISLSAGQWFTDTTNAFRAYSRHYLEHPEVQPLRDIFQTYELLAYLSVRASQLGMKTCEVPVTRAYPPKGKVPTKISFFKGNFNLFSILIRNLLKQFHP